MHLTKLLLPALSMALWGTVAAQGNTCLTALAIQDTGM